MIAGRHLFNLPRSNIGKARVSFFEARAFCRSTNNITKKKKKDYS